MLYPSQSLTYLSPLVFILTVLGIAPPPPSQQIYQPTNSSRSSQLSISDLLSANQSYSEPNSQLLKSNIVRCERRSYGIIDNPASCLNAFHSIPTSSTQRYTFGSRSLGHFEVPLPHRYLSPDGLCAIDISFSPRGAQWDSATYDEVANKAAAVLNECVLDKRRGPPTGGIVGGLGQNLDLIVIIRAYVPDVNCDPTTSFEDGGTCAIAVDTIPATRQKTTFTHQKSPPSPGTRQVEIPEGGKVFSERSNTCNATVELKGDDEPEQTTWFDIWQAAVAVDKICVENGHKGFSYVEGTNDNMIVSLGP